MSPMNSDNDNHNDDVNNMRGKIFPAGFEHLWILIKRFRSSAAAVAATTTTTTKGNHHSSSRG